MNRNKVISRRFHLSKGKLNALCQKEQRAIALVERQQKQIEEMERQWRDGIVISLKGLEQGQKDLNEAFADMKTANAEQHGELSEKLAEQNARIDVLFERVRAVIDDQNKKLEGKNVLIRVLIAICILLCGIIAGAKASTAGLFKALGFG